MGVVNMMGWFGSTMKCGGYDDAAADDPWKRFAAEIVIHAVDDWRTLVKRAAWLDTKEDKWCNFAELRNFFKSEWCAFLMQDFEIEPTRILELLEAELQEAMQKPVKKRRRGRFY